MSAQHAPEFAMHLDAVPTWARLLLLALVAGMIIVTVSVTCAVLWAAGKPPISWHRLKSVAVTAVWVACAMGVVGLVVFSARTDTVRVTSRVVDSHETAAAQPVLKPRLGIRQTSSDAPTWSVQPASGSQNPAQIVLSSQRFATMEEAEQQVTEQAAAIIRERCRSELPEEFAGEVPVQLINDLAVEELVGEVLDQDFGNGIKGKMYRAHLRLDPTSPKLRAALLKLWHSQLAEHRLMLLGSATGLITLLLGVVAGYFRLDDLTGGQYRGRLKLAAASLVTAGGLVAAIVIG